MVIRMIREHFVKKRASRLNSMKHEARLQGLAEALKRQLELKFGPLPDAYQNRIAKADEWRLLRWTERVLMAVTLAAVFEGVDDGLE